MLISVIFAWLTMICIVLTAVKYMARISKRKKFNVFFRKIHIPVGIFTIVFGLIHGILAGNAKNTTLENIDIGSLLFSFNWGTLCFVVIILLSITYLFRRFLKRYWFLLHRVFTIILIILTILHVLDMGITIPQFIVQKYHTSLEKEDLISNNIEQPIQEKELVEFSGANLKDGVYSGVAPAFKKELHVSVTVEKGKVIAIEVTENYETPGFLYNAMSIIDTIITKQSLEVDAISNATYSSAAIINAVANALQDAVISGELCINEIDLSNIRRR